MMVVMVIMKSTVNMEIRLITEGKLVTTVLLHYEDMKIKLIAVTINAGKKTNIVIIIVLL